MYEAIPLYLNKLGALGVDEPAPWCRRTTHHLEADKLRGLARSTELFNDRIQRCMLFCIGKTTSEMLPYQPHLGATQRTQRLKLGGQSHLDDWRILELG